MSVKYRKIEFDNGFRVILEQNDAAKSCAMGVWIGSGSVYENESSAGISHFIEHMLFKGTHRRSSAEIARLADSMGGELNAYTDRECTCYYTRVLAEDTAEAFDIIADMITSPRFDSGDIALEKGVVTEEIAMYESNPADLCADTFYLKAFDKSPFGRNILGSRDTVSAFNADMLRDHMRRFYSPERMAACFVGRFDESEILDKCREYFERLPAGENNIAVPPAEFNRGVYTLKKRTEQNQVIIGFESCKLGDGRRFAMQLLSTILGGSSSSRLFRKLREEQGLVYSVDSYQSCYLSAGLLTVSMGVSPGSECEAVKSAAEVLRRFPDTVTEQELELARKHYLSGLLMSLESNAARAGRYGSGELLTGSTITPEELERNIRAVTVDEVRAAAHSFSDLSASFICAVGKTAGDKFYEKVVSGRK